MICTQPISFSAFSASSTPHSRIIYYLLHHDIHPLLSLCVHIGEVFKELALGYISLIQNRLKLLEVILPKSAVVTNGPVLTGYLDFRDVVISAEDIVKPYSLTSYHNEELKSLTRYRFTKVRELAKLKISIARLVCILFPELEALVPTLHQASVYALLAEFPGASYVASANLTHLTHLLSESSNGRYGKELAVTIREAARHSIGASRRAESLELRHTILISFGYDPLRCPNCGKEMLILDIYYNHARVSLPDLYEKAVRKARQRAPAKTQLFTPASVHDKLIKTEAMSCQHLQMSFEPNI